MKKIMFNDRYGLTEAVLTGRKTMTRRIVPDIVLDWNRRGNVHVTNIHMEHGVLMMDLSNILGEPYITAAPKKYQPRYEIGEEIAVAQSYSSHDVIQSDPIFFEGMRKEAGWSNKMFVEAKYMPHRIRITDIKVERLQDISEEDCLREGIIKESVGTDDGTPAYDYTYDDVHYFDTPREAFSTLIDRISGKGTWERNPYVFAYTFELVK